MTPPPPTSTPLTTPYHMSSLLEARLPMPITGMAGPHERAPGAELAGVVLAMSPGFGLHSAGQLAWLPRYSTQPSATCTIPASSVSLCMSNAQPAQAWAVLNTGSLILADARARDSLPIAAYHHEPAGPAASVHAAPGSPLVGVGHAGAGGLTLWDPLRQTPVMQATCDVPLSACVQWCSPQVLLAASGRSLVAWDVRLPKAQIWPGALLAAEEDSISVLAPCTAQPHCIAIGSTGGRTQLLDTRAAASTHAVACSHSSAEPVPHRYSVSGLAWAPGSRTTLVSVSMDKTAALWDWAHATSPVSKWPASAADPLSAAAWLPGPAGSSLLLTAGWDSCVRGWAPGPADPRVAT